MMRTTNRERADFVADMKRRSMPLDPISLDSDAWNVVAKHMRESARAADRQFWTVAAVFLGAVFAVAAVAFWNARDRERPQDVAADCKARGMQAVEYRDGENKLLSIRCEVVH